MQTPTQPLPGEGGDGVKRLIGRVVLPPTEAPTNEVGAANENASTMGHETAKAIIATAAPRAGTAGACKKKKKKRGTRR